MKRFFLSITLLGGLILGLHGGAARADLDEYLSRKEPAFRWEKRGEEAAEGVKIYDLHLVSQVWQGITWEHRLQVFQPEKLEYPGFCTLYNTGGSGSASNTAMGVRLARETGATYAILYNIPKQPLFGGKTEDALVVHTWLKYMETGDESWPLHFPMAKGVLKAMDVVQAFSKESGWKPVDRFLVHGASKRGWTTWLAGASKDPRIVAIAPMVIDVLNVAKQAKYQLESYGKPSEQVDDYTSAGILQLLETPKGKKLLELEDPYSYRDRLTLPKLIILGTNDRYWTQDALNLYWDDLKGPKWVLYAPNSGHGLEDRERVFATLSAFARTVAAGKPWPQPKWSFVEKDGHVELALESDVAPREARLFFVQSKNRDFRECKWTFEPMNGNGGNSFTGRRALPATGHEAVFGEAVYEIDGRKFTLSTQIRITGLGK